jgi:hypothetical protein
VKTIADKKAHPEKQEFPMEIMELRKEIVVNEVHSEKQEIPNSFL